MATSVLIPDERAIRVKIGRNELTVELRDGRKVSVPLTWYPRLLKAKSSDRNNWRLVANGHGIHWPTLDEDLSVEGLLRGRPAPGTRKPTRSTKSGSMRNA